ncbi:MAG TPA: serine hydrolase domain-containing protein [Gemmatimonadaceae bacterium]|nr:serine hydrolase domain-containing protein [Gemmatimonadaceae bacterium]
MKHFMVLWLLGLVGASALQAQTAANRQKLDSIAATFVAANRTVGMVVAMVKGDDTLLMKAYGKADVEWDVPMQTDAMFEIGSVSKQFAAVSILQLRDAGKLSLDDRLSKWLPDVPGADRITLRHLLSHTSGVFGFADQDEFEINWFAPRYPRDSAYRLVKLDPFAFQPGTGQNYSNSGFWILGRVVELASGMKYEDYLRKQIFEPLGMRRSMYCDSDANIPRRAHGYNLVNGAIRRAPKVSYAWVFAPGAVCSTAGDLITWTKALHGGRVLSPRSYAEMTTQATLDDGTRLQYGMGIKVGEEYRGLKYIGHGGTAPGFRSDVAWYPDGQLAVVVLINTSPTNLVPGGVSFLLAAQVLPLPRPTMTYYTGDATDLVGKYQTVNGARIGNVTIAITRTDSGLAIVPPTPGARPALLAWAGGLRFYASDNTTITFRRANGDTGPVIEMRRDNAGNHAILKKVP